MSHPPPPQRTPMTDETQKYVRTMHNAALFMVVVCPVLALLPPRKLVNTAALVGITAFSADHLVREQTSRSIWQHVTQRPPPYVAARDTVASTHPSQQLAVAEEARAAASHRAAWKVQREKEIREDVEEGKGIFEMITDQIWEVWNQGKTEDSADDES